MYVKTFWFCEGHCTCTERYNDGIRNTMQAYNSVIRCKMLVSITHQIYFNNLRLIEMRLRSFELPVQIIGGFNVPYVPE